MWDPGLPHTGEGALEAKAMLLLASWATQSREIPKDSDPVHVCYLVCQQRACISRCGTLGR